MSNHLLGLLGALPPLALDSLAAGAALGLVRLPAPARRRAALAITVGEAGMPLVGLAAGRAVGGAVGSAAELAAAGALVLLGAWLLLENEEGEEGRLTSLARARGLAVVALALVTSLDELGVGLALGLLGAPAAVAVAVIAVQAVLAVQVGIRLGSRLAARLTSLGERLAGIVLLALGLWLGLAHLA